VTARSVRCRQIERTRTPGAAAVAPVVRIMAFRFALFVGLFVLPSMVPQAGLAAEVKMLSANVFTGVLDSVFSDFELVRTQSPFRICYRGESQRPRASRRAW
jgi:hypothetical protein